MKTWHKVLIGGLIFLVVILLGVLLLTGSGGHSNSQQEISVETQLK